MQVDVSTLVFDFLKECLYDIDSTDIMTYMWTGYMTSSAAYDNNFSQTGFQSHIDMKQRNEKSMYPGEDGAGGSLMGIWQWV